MGPDPNPMPDHLLRHISDVFLPNPPERIGVAVSGGGDSMALLHLMHLFCTLRGCKAHAVTVDHGLRKEAADEAQFVKSACRLLGIRHDTLTWEGWTGEGNLQKAARDARYALIGDWATDHGISSVVLAHTADDQAETVLMRLARRAGVDGLSAMTTRIQRHGVVWVRPLLSISRSELRSFLQREGIGWIEDPSNQDEAFDRIKARKALEALGPLGITAEGLAEVAGHMREARKALNWQAFLAAREVVTLDAGAVVLDEARLRLLPDEIARRLIVKAVLWVSGSEYAPRRSAIEALLQGLKTGPAGTLDGCHVRRIGDKIWLFREYEAIKGARCGFDDVWDGRWRIEAPQGAQVQADWALAALGEKGIAQCPGWRETGRPRQVLLASPAVWQGDAVIAAPCAGLGAGWHARIEGGEDTFFAALLTH